MDVCVVIPVFNAASFVEQAVRSAIEQPEVRQVILVEDGSTDDSPVICQRLTAEHREVELHRHPDGENRGPGESRNLGVRVACCDWIAFLDADDYYLPGRFREAAQVLATDGRIDGVYDAVGTEYESEDMRIWWAEQGRAELTTVRREVPPERLFEEILAGRNRSFHTNGVLVRRGLFDRTGPFDGHLRMCQDFAMWIKMAAVGRLAAGSLREPVAKRRLHGGNRIVRQRTRHRQYTYLMWETLARWSVTTGLPAARRRRLLQGMVGAWLALDPPIRRILSGHASPIRFLIQTALQYPTLAANRRYWRQLARALGGSRLRAFVQRRQNSVTLSGRKPYVDV